MAIDPRHTARTRLIHTGKRVLQWDDTTYRGALMQATGKNSTKSMSFAELDLVVTYMRKKGFVPQAAKPKAAKKAKALGKAPQDFKMRALWKELAEYGFVNDASEAALVNFALGQLKIDALNWADTEALQKVIEQLKKWRFRAEKALIRASGKSKAELEALALANFADERLTKDALANLKTMLGV